MRLQTNSSGSRPFGRISRTQNGFHELYHLLNSITIPQSSKLVWNWPKRRAVRHARMKSRFLTTHDCLWWTPQIQKNNNYIVHFTKKPYRSLIILPTITTGNFYKCLRGPSTNQSINPGEWESLSQFKVAFFLGRRMVQKHEALKRSENHLAFTRSKGADANLDKTRAKPWAKSTAKNTRRSAAAVDFSTSAAMGHEMKAKLRSKLAFSF